MPNFDPVIVRLDTKVKQKFMNWIFSLGIFMFSFTAMGQTRLSPQQVLDDYEVFKSILIKGHPSLYDYTSRQTWDSLLRHFEEKGLRDVTTSEDLFKSLSKLSSYAHDGHLIVHHSKMDSVPDLFPLHLKIIDGKLITDVEHGEIPLGSQIISVDGVEGSDLIQRMLKYASSDGYNLTKKYRQIEVEFGILHYYEFGAKRAYDVVCKTVDGRLHRIILEPQPFDVIGQAYAFRSSHFSNYHGVDDKKQYFESKIRQKWPQLHVMDSIKTAVLTVNSFGLEPQEFKSRLINLFKELRKKKVKHLIIDVRQNNGGYRINAINLYTFLSKTPFSQRTQESIITSTLPNLSCVLDTFSDYSKFVNTYFAWSEQQEEHWILKEDHAKDEMVPYKKPYKGEVYVLIGGRTFSAGSAFALSAKNDSCITLLGEETGGGYYFHNGQFPVLYRLPNSGIKIHMSFVKIEHYVTDTAVAKGSGILPDKEVILSVQDLVDGRDAQLDYVIKGIRNGE